MKQLLQAIKFDSANRVYYHLLLITLLFLSFLGLSLYLHQAFTVVKTADDKLAAEYDLTRAYRRIYVDLLNMETGVRGFQLSGSDEMLQPYIMGKERLKEDLETAKERAKNIPSELQQIENWEQPIVEYATLLDGQVSNKANYRQSIPSTQDLIKQKYNMDNLRNSIGNRINSKISEIESTAKKNAALANHFLLAIILGNIFFALSCAGVFIFITRNEKKLKTAEERVQKSEALYRTVLDAINDGVFEYDRDFKKIFLSEAHQIAMGVSFDPEGEDTEKHKERIHPDDLQTLMDNVDNIIKGAINSYNVEIRMMHGNGNYVWYLSRAFLLRDNNGNVDRIVGTHINIDEQKKYALELKHLNSEMETFTYVTSHDLRSPLVNLKGFSRELQFSISDLDKSIEKISDRLDENEKNKINTLIHDDISESINFITASVERMDSLTNALLDFARIGRHEYRNEEVNTQEIVTKCADSHGFEIKENNIEVIAKDLPTIISDRVALSQIFGNLIDNAIKYRRPNNKHQIIIECTNRYTKYAFTVSDNGRGIDDADKEKIFEIFRRARNVGTTRGQGLGMAYVRATVRKMGGDISFISEIDKGTSFTFTIPKKFNVNNDKKVERKEG